MFRISDLLKLLKIEIWHRKLNLFYLRAYNHLLLCLCILDNWNWIKNCWHLLLWSLNIISLLVLNILNVVNHLTLSVILLTVLVLLILLVLLSLLTSLIEICLSSSTTIRTTTSFNKTTSIITSVVCTEVSTLIVAVLATGITLIVVIGVSLMLIRLLL